MEKTTIKVGEQEIILNVGENITVAVLRKIYPIIKEQSGNEIEMVIEIIKALSDQEGVEDMVNNLSLEDFTILTEKIAVLIDATRKKKK